jgi:hypothetical protein
MRIGRLNASNNGFSRNPATRHGFPPIVPNTRKIMADDKKKRGQADRTHINMNEDYEV